MINDNEQRNGTTDRHEQFGKLAYSVADAATVTGLGRTTLYALMRSGKLPSFTIGKRRLIASADLEGLIGRARQAAA